MSARNDLAYWYPFVVASGVLTPRTEILTATCDLSHLLDGVAPEGFDQFLASLRAAGDRIGWPLFMRTGHGSGKHQYLDTCLVLDPDALAGHVAALVEWSFCVDFMGLPVDTWVLRELLQVDAGFNAFHGMPVAKERRYFVRDGAVFGWHPYWPPSAVADGNPTIKGERVPESQWRPLLDAINEPQEGEVKYLTALSERAVESLPGAWSIDWLYVPCRGWVCIDMADYQRSFVWTEYPTAPQDREPLPDPVQEWAEVARATFKPDAGR